MGYLKKGFPSENFAAGSQLLGAAPGKLLGKTTRENYSGKLLGKTSLHPEKFCEELFPLRFGFRARRIDRPEFRIDE